MSSYVHGYSRREAERLDDQASVLAPLLHDDTVLPAGSRVLEICCGTGAATAALLRRSPGIQLTAIDVSPTNLARAQDRLDALGLTADLRQADVYEPGLADGTFDAAVGCFALEHLERPRDALLTLRRLVRPRGSLIFVEGDHRSARFHPDTTALRDLCDAFEAAQRKAGGDPTIGLRLYGLLACAGFQDIRVSPRLVYADSANPTYRSAFVRRVFAPMMAGVRQAALAAGLDGRAFDEGMTDLLSVDTDPDGVVCYSFYKAIVRNR